MTPLLSNTSSTIELRRVDAGKYVLYKSLQTDGVLSYTVVRNFRHEVGCVDQSEAVVYYYVYSELVYLPLTRC
jgi:hypothetical protein